MFNNSDPFLLFDEKIALRNLDRMLAKVHAAGATFRPHFKTHQSLDIGRLCKDKGISAITVSSMGMAEYFSSEWDDILIAFPFNRLWLPRLQSLLTRPAVSLPRKRIAVLVDGYSTLEPLAGALQQEVGIWIEVETGSMRSGLDPGNREELAKMLDTIEGDSFLRLEGFYSHPGHSYRERDRAKVMAIFDYAHTVLRQLKEEEGERFSHVKINMGDTPCCSYAESFEGIDSISTGNFIFYDMTQVNIGSCETSDVAVCMAVPVVSLYPGRGEVLVAGGGIHFSKEVLQKDGAPFYGAVVTLGERGWSAPIGGARLKSISQEHGILQLPSEVISRLRAGDFLGVLPVHSCMTADCMGEYYEVSGRKYDHFSKKRRDMHT